MGLLTNELLNPCHFTHLVAKDIQVQNLFVLMTTILMFFTIMKFHVIINLGMTCKMHAISA
jgi:hypothetical protein